MSKSFLPPEFGVATKVVMVGVDQGSPAAQLLYHRLSGHISHFHQAARMARGDMSVAFRQQTLADGTRLSYSYNNGLEIVQVTVAPRTLVQVEQEVKTPTPTVQLEPLLAIDVLFHPDDFEVGDIFSHTKSTETVIVPGQPIGDPMDPDNWDVPTTYHRFFTSTSPTVITEGSWGYIRGWYYTTKTYYLDELARAAGGAWGEFAEKAFLEFLETDGRNQVSPGSAAIIGTMRYYGGIFGNGVLGGEQSVNYGDWLELWEAESPANWIGPRGPDTTETVETLRNKREKRTYFDVLNVVGTRVEDDPDNPEDEPYEANSLGDTDDARLTPVTAAARSMSRTISINDPDSGEGFLGSCFVARPRVWPPNPGEDPKKLTVKLYAASINVAQHNQLPGKETSAFGTDDDTMNYIAKTELRVKVRARELGPVTPIAVRVNLTTEGKIERFVDDEGGGYPSIEAGTETISAARVRDWSFAALDTWQPGGGEPADPAAVDVEGKSTMGELLDEEGYSTINVSGPQPMPRSVPAAPAWTQPVEEMTQIGYVEWTPPKPTEEHGTGVVVLFGGGGPGEGGEG